MTARALTVDEQILCCASRLTPRNGDRLTNRTRELLNEIARLDESLAYDLSYVLEPNWWLDLWLRDQADFGPEFPACIETGAFPFEPQDPLDIALDAWNTERCK